MQKFFLLLLLLGLGLPAAARMYQWVDPETGTTQLSGKPPVWYRSAEGGPRVLVFDNGRVVDDTGIEVSEGTRERLRQQALVRAERDREQARKKLLESRRMQAVLDKERQASEQDDEESAPVPQFEPEQQEEQGREPERDEERTAEAMRELIREWERMRTQDAREVIGSDENGSWQPVPGAPQAPGTPPPPPPPSR